MQKSFSMHVRVNFSLFPCLLSLCLSHSDIAYSTAWLNVWISFRILTSREFCFSFLLLLVSDLMQLSQFHWEIRAQEL